MLKVESPEALTREIRKLQRVSEKLKGRTSDQVEWMTLANFLAAHMAELAYPLVVTKGEKPDFTISFPTTLWGVEITEAIHPDYNRLRAILEDESPDLWFIDPSHFKWGAPKRSLSELRALASQTELSGLPWMGNEVEEEFAAMLEEVVKRKTQKLASGKYQRCDRDILLIYSNQSLAQMNIQEGASLAAKVLNWSAEGFHMVSVVKGGALIEFAAGQIATKPIPKFQNE